MLLIVEVVHAVPLNKDKIHTTTPTVQTPTTTPQSTNDDGTTYNIECSTIELQPIITVNDCKLIVTAGQSPTRPLTTMGDFGNVRFSAPFNINERAHLQSNAFATVHNLYPAKVPRSSPTR